MSLTDSPGPASQRGAVAPTVLSFSLFMLITMLRLFVRRQRVRVGQWPEWPSSAILLTAVSSRSAAGRPGPLVSQTIPLPEKLKFVLVAGTSLVAPVNAPHLLLLEIGH